MQPGSRSLVEHPAFTPCLRGEPLTPEQLRTLFAGDRKGVLFELGKLVNTTHSLSATTPHTPAKAS